MNTTFADNVIKTKLANDVLSQKTLKQLELEKLAKRNHRRNPVKKQLELTNYGELEKALIQAKGRQDAEQERKVFNEMKLMETSEVLIRTHLDQLVVMSEAGYECVYNGATEAEKVQWEIWRPRWLGMRQKINLENEINAHFYDEEGLQNVKNVVSKVLVEDILKQATSYKENSRIGFKQYNDKRERYELWDSKPFRSWFHNEYNGVGVEFSVTKLDLIKNLAEGNFEEAFEGIDFVSLTQAERDQIVNKLTPKKNKENKNND